LVVTRHALFVLLFPKLQPSSAFQPPSKPNQQLHHSRTSMVVSPTVVKESQAQFGCDKVQGAFLENEGGQGSANAHWEYRWFQGELMVATNLFAVRACSCWD